MFRLESALRPLLTSLVFTCLVGPVAHAGSVDRIEVGGPWGTPGATNPSALWWNPAGLAAEPGVQALTEVALWRAQHSLRRAATDTGAPGGRATISTTRVIPFLGASSDFAVPGLGVGVALFSPTQDAASFPSPNGPFRFTLRDEARSVWHATIGMAYRLRPQLMVGATVALLDGRYNTQRDRSLYLGLAEGAGIEDVDLSRLEDADYAATETLTLRGQALTAGVGLRLRPLGDERLVFAVAYNHRAQLRPVGPARFELGCPPATDPTLRAQAETWGLCDSTLDGVAEVTWMQPARVHLGLVVRPSERLRLEAFGAWVGWSSLRDITVTTALDTNEVEVDDPSEADAAVAQLAGTQRWARDNRNSGFVGLDAKWQASQSVGLGVRSLFDRSAVPEAVLGPHNLEYDTLVVGGVVWVSPYPAVDLSFLYSHYVLLPREVSDSAYTLSPDAGVAPRYRYASTAGSYQGESQRLGIALNLRLQ